jgi:hypothetical protein
MGNDHCLVITVCLWSGCALSLGNEHAIANISPYWIGDIPNPAKFILEKF